MRPLTLLTAVFALLAALVAPLASAAPLAGESTAAGIGVLFTPEEAADFSKQIERDLAARGARVAMVFRTGRTRETLPDGVAYTHGAFWVYSEIATEDGRKVRGYAVHNLYAGDGMAWAKTESRLVQDWPYDFVAPSAVDDVAVIVPAPDLQARLLESLASGAYGRAHNPDYSLIAHPWAGRYQSCTTFMANVLAAAIWQTEDPAQIQASLRAWFEPAEIRPGFLTRLFGPLADPRLRMEDQSGPIRTATYESLAAFLDDYDLLEATYVLRYAPD